MLGKPAGMEAPLPSTITGEALRHLWLSSIAVSTGALDNGFPIFFFTDLPKAPYRLTSMLFAQSNIAAPATNSGYCR